MVVHRSTAERWLGRVGTRFGLGDAVLVEVNGAEHGDVLGDEMMIRSELVFTDVECSGGRRFRSVGVASSEGETDEVVSKRGCAVVVGSCGRRDQIERFAIGASGQVVSTGVLVLDRQGTEGPCFEVGG